MNFKEKLLTFGGIALCIFMIFIGPMLLTHANKYDFLFYMFMAITLYANYLYEKIKERKET